MTELTYSCHLRAGYRARGNVRVCVQLCGLIAMQRVTTASICPDLREGYL